MVIFKIANLQEIENHWSLEDVWKANQLLDMQQAAEEEEMEKVSKT